MPSRHLILCHPLFLLPPISPSIRVFSNESALRMKWPKYWSFSFSISPSKEHPGLISFRMDWLDLLTVQGTLKSLLQHHSSKPSILWRSAFFTVQLSHPYMTTGKTIALTRWTFVSPHQSNSSCPVLMICPLCATEFLCPLHGSHHVCWLFSCPTKNVKCCSFLFWLGSIVALPPFSCSFTHSTRCYSEPTNVPGTALGAAGPAS